MKPLPDITSTASIAAAARDDKLSLCRMHGSHVDLCIADHPVKTYIPSVAVEAAPYPPPSDPLLATPDLGHILLPWLGSTGSAHILLPCAGPYLRFGFGPIIRLQLRLEPFFSRFVGNTDKIASRAQRFAGTAKSQRFSSPLEKSPSLPAKSRLRKNRRPPLLHGCLSRCAFVSSGPPFDSHRDQHSGVRGAAPPRSDAPADDPWALLIPSGGALPFPVGTFLPSIPANFADPPAVLTAHAIETAASFAARALHPGP